MRFPTFVAVAALCTAALAGCSTVGPQYVVPTERPLAGTAPAWTPSSADIARAERGLRPYLRSLGGAVHGYEHGPPWNRLGDYARQYVGVYRNGHRVIWINMFDTTSAFYEKGQETQTLMKQAKCGDCNLEAYFDADTGRYSDFWESAPLIR
jgi:hypothetical protein